MQYGLIGERLGHSFSKEIHERLTDYIYEPCELAPSELAGFLRRRDFKGINVTVPYKEAVIPFLDGGLDETAARVGAVNVVVNRGGRLSGYNTDAAGFRAQAAHAGVSFRGRRVLILGTGGAAKAVRAMVIEGGAAEVLHAVRHQPEKGEVSYESLRAGHDAEVIVNATPVGMLPDVDGRLVDLNRFPHLKGVLDCVANPLRTPLVCDTLQRGLPAEGGTYMLVAQALLTIEIFLGRPLAPGTLEETYRSLLREKTNIVLTGMPSSGKSTVGRLLAEKLGRPLVDTDACFEERFGMSIADYAARYGEAAFREREAEAVASAACRQGLVIATGGGAVMREDSVRRLRQNGVLLFLDRPLEKLTPTPDRPFSADAAALRRRYEERYPVYRSTADARIVNDGSLEAVMDRVTEALQILLP